MKLIIDCNVVIAAGLKDGVCRAVLRASLQRGEIYLSREIVLEYLLVSRRDKFKAYQSYLKQLIELISQGGNVIGPSLSSFDLPDPNDRKYIDLAVHAQADFLITGNLVHFPQKKYGSTEVISPRQYIDMVLKE